LKAYKTGCFFASVLFGLILYLSFALLHQRRISRSASDPAFHEGAYTGQTVLLPRAGERSALFST
jgi:uncharacterized protein (DUF58 family)